MYFDFYLFGALLTFVGGALSFYFYGVYSNLFRPEQKLVPSFCRLSNTDCTSIVDTKYGRLLGYSNAIIGTFFLLFHTILLVGSSLNLIHYYFPFIMSIFSITIGAYLLYGLIKLKVKCNICISIHVINIMVFIIQIPRLIEWALAYIY